jgi:uncharacterized protein YjbJ (UPF0337 family)
MSNNGKRAEGAAQEFGGRVERAAGKVLGNEELQAKGNAKIVEGEAKQAAAKAAERTKGTAEKAIGAVKKGAGELLDNEQLEAEGSAQKLTGEARKNANK